MKTWRCREMEGGGFRTILLPVKVESNIIALAKNKTRAAPHRPAHTRLSDLEGNQETRKMRIKALMVTLATAWFVVIGPVLATQGDSGEALFVAQRPNVAGGATVPPQDVPKDWWSDVQNSIRRSGTTQPGWSRPLYGTSRPPTRRLTGRRTCASTSPHRASASPRRVFEGETPPWECGLTLTGVWRGCGVAERR